MVDKNSFDYRVNQDWDHIRITKAKDRKDRPVQKSETAVDVYKKHLEPHTVQKSRAVAAPKPEPTDAVGVYQSFLAKAEAETEEEKKKREEREAEEKKSKEDQ